MALYCANCWFEFCIFNNQNVFIYSCIFVSFLHLLFVLKDVLSMVVFGSSAVVYKNNIANSIFLIFIFHLFLVVLTIITGCTLW